MRWAVVLAIVTAAAAATGRERVRLPGPALGRAAWMADGSGFVVSHGVEGGQLWRFDADGKPLGVVRNEPLGRLQASRGAGAAALSPDGRRWAIEAYDEDAHRPTLFVVDLAAGTLQRLAAGDANTDGVEWTRDGTIVFRSATLGAAVADPASGRVTALCPALNGRYARVAPDGRRIVLGGEAVVVTDVACSSPRTLLPATAERTLVLDVVFSPSGKLVAAWQMRQRRGQAATQHLIILSLDGRQRVDVGTAPAGGRVVWLDDETLVYPVSNRGANDQSMDTGLQTMRWRTRATSWLVPPDRRCHDSWMSASPRGGRVVFQRECDKARGTWLELVRKR